MKKILLIIALFLLLENGNAQTQINKYCVNGTVITMLKAPDGGMYLGGYFSNIAEYCGTSVKLNTAIAPGFNANDVRTEGIVRATVSIPDGGWYVGGDFRSVSGIDRMGLARINADGSLNEFNPYLGEIANVQSLALDVIGRLYVGFRFSDASNPVAVYKLWRFNMDGTVDNSFNPTFNGNVNAIAFDSNNNMYVGGAFTTPRNRLAKFDADGTLNAFNPVFDTGAVLAVKLTSNGDFLVGGSFLSVNGNPRNRLARFNADTSLHTFNPVINGNVAAIEVDNFDNFYIGGAFTTINSISKTYLAKFNTDGSVNSTILDLFGGTVSALKLDSSGALYCGGTFTQVSSVASRRNFVKFNSDGTVNSYNPIINDAVYAIAADASGTVYAGGLFKGIKAVTRGSFVKLNADNTISSFTASVSDSSNQLGTINAMVLDGLGNLYIGGIFHKVNGTIRYGVAKFNPDLTLNAFNPGYPQNSSFGNNVSTMACDSANNLYVGGSFDHMGGTYRFGFAKLNSNGTLNSFNPVDFGAVSAMTFDSQGNLYIGGAFNTILGQPRTNFAKFNPDLTLSPVATLFNVQIYDIALDSAGNIYAGGRFTEVNGVPRTYLAKINPDGSLNNFNPVVSYNVNTVEISPSGNLYAGGSFSYVNGLTRNGFVKFNLDETISGMVQHGFGSVKGLYFDNSTLHIGGTFQGYKVYSNANGNCDLTLSNPIPGSRCGTGIVNLSITPSSGTVNWYDAPENGNLIGTGTPFVTPAISSTTTYYAQAIDGACISFSRTEVVANVMGCPTNVNLKLFIEAYYEAGAMKPVKFNQDGISPITDVEDITVELRNTAAPYSIAYTTTAVLKTDGTALCTFPTSPVGSFYIAVSSRNSIKTWSAVQATVGPTPLTYDFTTAVTKAYGNNMVELEPGVFGFYSGDINQDGSIDNTDAPDLFNDIDNSAYGIIPTDLNGDGAVDNTDVPFYLNNSDTSIYSHDPNNP